MVRVSGDVPDTVEYDEGFFTIEERKCNAKSAIARARSLQDFQYMQLLHKDYYFACK